MSDLAKAPRGTDGDFFVGYLPNTPKATVRFLRGLVLLMGVFSIGVAALLASLQAPFDQGFFDFGNLQEISGTLIVDPSPALFVGQDADPLLLVGMGKHGLEVGDLASGTMVKVTGTSIEAPQGSMLEVASIVRTDPSGATETPTPSYQGMLDADLSEAETAVSLIGEIVDTKCRLGVMKPGSGKTHRSCASLCIRGGIPAALVVQQGDGSIRLYVLVGSSEKNSPIGPKLLPFVGEPVQVQGKAFQIGSQWYLRTDVASVRRWKSS